MNFMPSRASSATLLTAVLSVMAPVEEHLLHRRPPEGLPLQNARKILYVICEILLTRPKLWTPLRKVSLEESRYIKTVRKIPFIFFSPWPNLNKQVNPFFHSASH